MPACRQCSASLITPGSLSIGPNQTTTETIPVSAAGTITDVNLRLDISHTWVADLEIELD